MLVVFLYVVVMFCCQLNDWLRKQVVFLTNPQIDSEDLIPNDLQLVERGFKSYCSI